MKQARVALEPEQIVRLDATAPAVVLLDQRRLPDEVVELECRTIPELADAIRTLAVRGAPAIGVAAAYGMALAALRGDELHEAERTQILRALELANGIVAGPNGAAARLRIKRSTLMSRMQRLGISASRNYIVSGQPEATHRAAYA